MKERALIGRLLAPIARSTAARGLLDDAAVWQPPAGQALVLTKDMMAAGVHFLPDDPPAAIAAKLLRVNLSDLAAKGAVPQGVLLGLGLPDDIPDAWIEAFVAGLGADLDHFGVALWGGDTIGGVDRVTLSLTAIGQVPSGGALGRMDARAGDTLYVTGSIGDGLLGLHALTGEASVALLSPDERAACIARYRCPEPRVGLGPALVGLAHACADVSDGLLADAGNIAEASGLKLVIDLAAVPRSPAGVRWSGADVARRLALATAGDDYELVFTAPASAHAAVLAVCQRFGVRVSAIGRVEGGTGVVVLDDRGRPLTVDRAGYQHG